MKKFLLIGTALLSIAPYAGAMNSDQKDSKINSEEKAPKFSPPSINNNNAPLPPVSKSSNEWLSQQWNEAIMPALLNKDISLGSFQELIDQFKKDYEINQKDYEINQLKKDFLRYGGFICIPAHLQLDQFHFDQYPGVTTDQLYLDLSVLNSGIRQILDTICTDLTEILEKEPNPVDNNALDGKIAKNWDVICKLSLLPHNGDFLYKNSTEEAAIAISKNLIKLVSVIHQSDSEKLRTWFAERSLSNLACCINKPDGKPLSEWFTHNSTCYFFQNTLEFFMKNIQSKDESLWREIIQKEVPETLLYASKDKLDLLTVVTLLPCLTKDCLNNYSSETKYHLAKDVITVLKGYIDAPDNSPFFKKKEILENTIEALSIMTPSLPPEELIEDLGTIPESLSPEELIKVFVCAPGDKESFIDRIDTKYPIEKNYSLMKLPKLFRSSEIKKIEDVRSIIVEAFQNSSLFQEIKKNINGTFEESAPISQSRIAAYLKDDVSLVLKDKYGEKRAYTILRLSMEEIIKKDLEAIQNNKDIGTKKKLELEEKSLAFRALIEKVLRDTEGKENFKDIRLLYRKDEKKLVTLYNDAHDCNLPFYELNKAITGWAKQSLVSSEEWWPSLDSFLDNDIKNIIDKYKEEDIRGALEFIIKNVIEEEYINYQSILRPDGEADEQMFNNLEDQNLVLINTAWLLGEIIDKHISNNSTLKQILEAGRNSLKELEKSIYSAPLTPPYSK